MPEEKWGHIKTTEARKKAAIDLAKSIRGQYIISQALYVAAEVLLTREPEILREPSNAADMKLIHEQLFPIYNREMWEEGMKKWELHFGKDLNQGTKNE